MPSRLITDHLRFSVSQTKLTHFACLLSHTWLFSTPRTVAHQAPLSMCFPRQEYWRGLPFPSPGNLPNPGIPHFLRLLHWQVGFFTSWATGKWINSLASHYTFAFSSVFSVSVESTIIYPVILARTTRLFSEVPWFLLLLHPTIPPCGPNTCTYLSPSTLYSLIFE